MPQSVIQLLSKRLIRFSFTPSLAFGVLAVLGGCSSNPPMKAVDTSTSQGDSTLILVNYEFDSDHEVGTKTGCKIRIRHIKTEETYEIELEPNNNTAIIEAPKTGSFERSSVYCGFGRVWQIPKTWDAHRFKIYPKKLNYLGMFSLKLSKEATELKMGYHHDKDYSTLIDTVKDLDDALLNRMVSAYTGLPITPKILEIQKAVYFPNVRVKAVKSVVDRVNDSPDVAICVEDEKRKNPLFLGKLTFVALYENNKLAKLKRIRNDHVYSKRFIRCVKKEIARFKPKVREKIEFTVEF